MYFTVAAALLDYCLTGTFSYSNFFLIPWRSCLASSSKFSRITWVPFNLLVPNEPFRYPMKAWCFQGAEKGCTGNKWVIWNFFFNSNLISCSVGVFTTDNSNTRWDTVKNKIILANCNYMYVNLLSFPLKY